LFGEAYYHSGKWRFTLGDRAYRLRNENASGFDGVLYGSLRSNTAGKASGHSPRVALSWHADKRSMWYASAARGFRAGGSQADLGPLLGGCVSPAESQALATVKPDALWSYEAGAKFDFPDPGLLLTGALYRIDWKDIQQPAFIPSCAFYLLGNAGAARLQGGEVELQGRAAPGLELRVAAGYTDAVVSEQGSSRQLAGTRLRQVPRWNFSAGFVLVRALRPGLTGFASADYSATGDSVSANSTQREMIRPAYGLFNARLGLRWSASELSLDMKNLGDTRPNLGDLGYLGYLRFAPDGTTPMPMVATLPPRTLSLQFRQRF
jgi:outer membrane receptor protein involved in Fe transport